MHSSEPEAYAPHGVAFGPAFTAPAHWRQIDFISDLHLQATEPLTFECWRNFMLSTPADAVFILGDLFEVWVGDDVVEQGLRSGDSPHSFEARCKQVLQQASQRMAVNFMHGNRDFLLGPAFATACGMTLLHDPTVLGFANARWLLTHGDALCLADTEYIEFRTLVRSQKWQSDFLSQPLVQRQATARALRTQSESRKQSGERTVHRVLKTSTPGRSREPRRSRRTGLPPRSRRSCLRCTRCDRHPLP